MKIQRTTYLSLGSNQGNKIEILQKAVNLVAKKIGSVLKISAVYKTKSWGFKGEDFYNICIKVSTFLNSDELITTALEIEKSLGRTRANSEVYVNRNIDIDILLFEDEIILSKELIVPHPKMLERNFVLIPLSEIAPNTIHPVTKKNDSKLLN